jgi:trehalose-6-phosphate synthase
MDSSHWDTYQAVNRRFARTVARISNADDYIWVQDYHLLLLARNLRGVGAEHRTGFFLHTSFLSPDVFGRLPWRAQVIKAMLDYDLVGFQAHRDRDNSMQCVEHCTERSARDLHYEKAGRLNLPGSKASVVEGLL